MMRRPLRALVLLALASTSRAQAPWTACEELPGRSAADRGGLHQASLALRCTDEAGKAVAGARVVAYAVPEGWGTAPVPLAATTTDASGRARLADLETAHPVVLRIAAAGLRERVLGVAAPSGAASDLGDVSLEPGISIAGRLEVLAGDGTPRGEGRWHVAISRPGKTAEDDREMVEGMEARDGWFAFDGLAPAADAFVEVSGIRDGRWCVFEAPFALGRSRRVVLRAKEATLEKKGFRELGALEVADAPDLEVALPPLTFKGRVVDRDGRPLAGCRVRTFRRVRGEMAPFEGWGVTGEDGGFELALEDRAGAVVVEGPFGSAERRWLPDADGPSTFELRLGSCAELPLSVAPPDSGATRFAYGTSEGAWLPCAASQIGRYAEAEVSLAAQQDGPAPCYRAEREGWVPQVAVVDAQSEAIAFSFAGGVPFQVRVLVGRQALPGAVVDVDLVDDGAAWGDGSGPRRLAVARLRAGAEGRIALRAHASHAYEITAYAEGCEPAAVRWVPGREAVLSLVRRRFRVAFDALSASERARIERAGTGEVVAVASASMTLDFAPGAYDAVVIDPAGSVLRGKTFQVDARTRRVALGADERPSVEVELPEGESVEAWTVGATRRVPALGASGAAVAPAAGSVAWEPAASVLAEGPRKWRVTVPSPGRYVLAVAPRGSGLVLLRELAFEGKAPLTVAVPPITVVARGVAGDFPRGFEGSHQGVAGPRLHLVSAPADRGGTGWDVLVGLPDPGEAKGSFHFGPVPAGRYFVHEHLTDLVGAAWGGLPVDLSSAKPELPDLAATPPADLGVQVVDARGKPVSDAVLTIRDPMSASWLELLRTPSTAALAAHPLPAPPSFRLDGRPLTIPRVRPGHLELEVVTAAGRRFRFHREVAAGSPLQIALP